MAHPLTLGAQVLLVVPVGRGDDLNLLGDAEPVPLEADDLLRVVGQDPDLGQTEVPEDLGADAVVAEVGREPPGRLPAAPGRGRE